MSLLTIMSLLAHGHPKRTVELVAAYEARTAKYEERKKRSNASNAVENPSGHESH